MRTVSDNIRRESTKKLFSITFPKNRATHEVTWKNMVQPDTT